VRWSEYLDGVISQRTDAARTAHRTQLQTKANAAISAAVDEARTRAAALADGEALPVESPETIVELHQAAAAQIDPATFDEDKLRSAGERTVRRIAEDQALSQLVAAGN
jgi:hypothetical protein